MSGSVSSAESEARRLDVLLSLSVLDTEAEVEFDQLTKLTRSMANAEIALISLVDRDRQWFKSRAGLDAAETPRDIAFCAHAILQKRGLWVADARIDDRFKENPLVLGPPFIRFYAGTPLIIANERIGTLCVLDSKPRDYDEHLAAQLAMVAEIVVQKLSERPFRLFAANIIETTSDAVMSADSAQRITQWSPAAERMFGYTADEMLGRSLSEIVPSRLQRAHDSGFRRFVAGGVPKLVGRTVEVPGLRRDGTEFPMELALSAWTDSGVVQVGAIVRDVSERKARDAERLQAEVDARAAQSEMSLSLSRLSAALETVPGAMAIFDPDDRLIVWNERYADLHPECAGLLQQGLSFRAMIEAALDRGVYPEAEGRRSAWLADRLAARARPAGTHDQRMSDGRWLRVEEHRVTGGEVVSLCTDVTELKQRAESFELLFERNPAPMWLIDRATKAFISVNEAAAQTFGYNREAFADLTLINLLHPDEHGRMWSGEADEDGVLNTPDVWTYQTADQRDLRIQITTSHLEVGGRPAMLVALFDVTERMRAAEELGQTRAFLDAVVESVPAMLVVKDVRDGRFVLLNRAGEDLLGVGREDFIGKTDYDLFPIDQADAFVARDRAVIAEGGKHVVEDEPITTPRGLRHLQTTKLTMPGPDGHPAFLLAIAEDITDRNMAAEALKAAAAGELAANRAKDDFLANMSHEMRTPLNGVIGLAGVLARSNLEPSQQELIALIEDSAKSLDRLLSDVLDISRLSVGQVALLQEPFDLSKLLSDVHRVFQLKAEEKRLSLTLNVDPACMITVVGDDLRLKQILGNLLGNAIKFTAVGKVSLDARRGPHGSVIIEVADTGIGFDEQSAARIFDRFKQAEATTTRLYGGTGLGLSISRGLAEQMGGTLEASSTPGVGAVFMLTLPSSLACLSGEELSAETSDTGSGWDDEEHTPVRVLLAEDNATNRLVVKLILEGVGANLVSVDNGHEAVETFKADAFDVVLMDLQMPVMDGLTAIREIRRFELETGAMRTPIIVVSANDTRDDHCASLGAGADAHLGKPLSAPALIDQISLLTDPVSFERTMRIA